jgi:hypothetical protein
MERVCFEVEKFHERVEAADTIDGAEENECSARVAEEEV